MTSMLLPGTAYRPGSGGWTWLLVTAGQLILMSTGVRTGSCPRACFCNELSRTVYCSGSGLKSIPSGIDSKTKELNMNGNVFESKVLSRSNFSQFTALEHLYLGGCGIEDIELDTFRDLSSLKYLDLNNNRIKIIEDYTFRGLNLMHLFLNGNRNIRLSAKSFEGLVTTGLYLHDCSLSDIPVSVLGPLNSTLGYLWLSGNQLETLDKQFLPLFANLRHLRLGSNPLHCNCELGWLKDFYDAHPDKFDSAVVPPSCLTPQGMKGKFFNELSADDLRCTAPTFKNIDAIFDDNRGRLKCTATGDPAPTLYWIQPSGKSNRYRPPDEEDIKRNEGVLNLAPTEENDDLAGMYICVAHNDAGSVTLTINVTWPHTRALNALLAENGGPGLPQNDQSLQGTDVHFPDPDTAPLPTQRRPPHHPSGTTSHSVSTTSTPVPKYITARRPPSPSLDRPHTPPTSSHTKNTDPNGGKNNNVYTGGTYNFTALNMLDMNRRKGGRLFTLTELVGAVIGTHVCTLLLCLIFMPLYYKKKTHRDSRHHNLEKAPAETLYLNGLGHHSVDYLDTPNSTIKR